MKTERILMIMFLSIVVGFSFLLSGCGNACKEENTCPAMNSISNENEKIPKEDAAVSKNSDEPIFEERSITYPASGRAAKSVKINKMLPEKIVPDQKFDYRIKVTNLTDETLQNITVTDSVSSNLLFVDSEPEIERINGNEISWVLPVLKPGADITINAKAVATGGEQIKSSAMVDYECLVCSRIEIIDSNLKLVKDAPETISSCERIILDYEIINHTSTVAKDLVLTEKLQPGLITPEGKNIVEFELSSLEPGQTRRFTQIVDAVAPGNYSGKAMLSASDGMTCESNITEINVTQPVLSLQEIFPEHLEPDSETVLDFVVSNIGDSIANDTMIIAELPEGVEFTRASNNGIFDPDGTSQVSWKLGDLMPSSSKIVSLTVKNMSSKIPDTHAVAKAKCANSVTSLSDEMVEDLSNLLFYRPYKFE